MKMKLLTGTLFVLFCWCAGAHAAATASWTTGLNGGKLVRLENAYLRLDIDPQLGARGAVLIDKKTGKDWMYGQSSREGSGLFMDHFWEQNWPGEFLFTPYAAEILPTTDGTASACFSIASTGKWGPVPQPMLTGLQLRRTITLAADSPVLHVKVQVTNPTADGKVMGYWMQNVLWAGGDREHDCYLRPNYRKVSRVGWDWKTKAPILGFMESEFERAPTAGWSAVVDEQQHAGMAFLMDYGSVMFLYNCLQNTTLEWQYLQAAIPPGKTWETAVTAVLFKEMDGLVHVTPEALFNAAYAVKPEGLDITLQAARLDQPITSARLAVTAFKLVSRQEVTLPAVEFKDLTLAPQSATVRLPGPFTEQIALKVDAHLTLADGTTRDMHFEDFFGGSLGFAGINRTIDLPPMYPLPAQPKTMRFLKPDTIERLRQTTARVLVVNGRDCAVWQAEKAAAALPAEVKTSYL
ncbi:MAG TPA: hypothetical protein VGM23_04635, partial [Armatimonadota bacterium]